MNAATHARFRPLAAGDADLVAALHAACFGEDMTAKAVRLLLGVPGTWGLLGYTEEGPGCEPFGYCLVRGARDEWEILNIGVRRDLRRRGFGRALLGAVLGEAGRRGAARLFLEVAEDNPAARRLYETRGFKPVGHRPGYYRRSTNRRVDAVLMCLDLATYTLTEESN